jgi:hypothetical protein
MGVHGFGQILVVAFFPRRGTVFDRSHSHTMAKPLQHQVIARALELIADEANWSEGAWARTASGKPCPWTDPAAKSFCALGALNRAAFELVAEGGYELAISAAKQVVSVRGGSHAHLPEINDSEGHAVVIAMFRRALS